MTTLRDYFPPRQLPLPPAAANADPVTSHIAAREITASGMRQTRADAAAALVRERPGMTALELATVTGWCRHELAKRLADAEHQGRVVKGGARPCSVSKRSATVWYPTINAGDARKESR